MRAMRAQFSDYLDAIASQFGILALLRPLEAITVRIGLPSRHKGVRLSHLDLRSYPTSLIDDEHLF